MDEDHIGKGLHTTLAHELRQRGDNAVGICLHIALGRDPEPADIEGRKRVGRTHYRSGSGPQLGAPSTTVSSTSYGTPPS